MFLETYVTAFPIIDIFLILLTGLVFGSFVTMASYRLPKGEDTICKRSHCTSCQHNLRINDLIPLFSWLCTKGKCRYCHVPISKRYPLIELSTALSFALVYWRFGLTFHTLLLLLVVTCLMIIIVVDLEHYIIPDATQGFLAVLAIIYGFSTPVPAMHMITGAIAGIAIGLLLRFVCSKWKKQEALGLGDVKFLGIAGLFLGPYPLPVFFFIAGVAGIVTALCWDMLGKGKCFPFAPALVIALFICLLFPEIHDVGAIVGGGVKNVIPAFYIP